MFGRWTECVGVDGAYFWDPKTNEVVWEIPESELEKIKRDMEEIKQDKAERLEAKKQQAKGSQPPPKQKNVIENPVPRPASPTSSKRASVVIREKQLSDIRHEREIMAKEKVRMDEIKSIEATTQDMPSVSESLRV